MQPSSSPSHGLMERQGTILSPGQKPSELPAASTAPGIAQPDVPCHSQPHVLDDGLSRVLWGTRGQPQPGKAYCAPQRRETFSLFIHTI